MTKLTKTLAKGTLGTVAAGAMALASATPAMARDRDRGIDAGDIIAGALILGGIAAVASSSSSRNNGYRNNGYRNNGYSQGNSRAAVERCVRVAERRAKRAGYRFADVTQIRDVDRTRYGYRVKGRLVVDGARGYRGAYNNNRYNNRTRYDERRYEGRYDRGQYRGDRADRGKFTCHIERGQRAQVQYRGIRGL
ncbi:MAG: hypothetical protein ABJP34_07275 [Erythrobacter sp.]